MLWEDIEGYEGLYSVSEDGRIYSVRGERTLKPFPHPDGHLQVGLSSGSGRRKFYVHRLVAAAFIPNPKVYPIVRHLNGDPTDNQAKNLAWGTQSDNLLDAVKHGTHSQAKKTHCPRGHRLVRPPGSKKAEKCQPCSKVWRTRGMAPDDPRHGSNAGYCTGCRCDRCKAGKKASR